MTPRVLAIVEPVMTSLGAEDDPPCWVIWGDDPGMRYVVLVPTEAGLLQVLVRVNVPGEGPRASAKVIRWHRVQLGELALEMVSGHRLLGFQVESHVLRGSDDEGDDMASFALELFSRVDGRPFTPRASKRRGGKAGVGRSSGGKAGAAKSSTAKSSPARGAAAKPAAAKPAAADAAGTSPAKPARGRLGPGPKSPAGRSDS
jgi:hypothetical protein